MLVGPDIASTGVPLMRTVLPTAPFEGGGIGIVAAGTARNGVLLMIVKLPVTPGGTFANGILVAAGMTKFGTSEISTVFPTLAVGLACGTAMFVAPETMIYGILLIRVVAPVRPGGAFETGILVGPGIATKGELFIKVTLAPGIMLGAGEA